MQQRISGVEILDIIENADIVALFKSYPSPIRKKLNALRRLIFETASEIENNDVLEEVFRWSEASYLC